MRRPLRQTAYSVGTVGDEYVAAAFPWLSDAEVQAVVKLTRGARPGYDSALRSLEKIQRIVGGWMVDTIDVVMEDGTAEPVALYVEMSPPRRGSDTGLPSRQREATILYDIWGRSFYVGSAAAYRDVVREEHNYEFSY